MFGSFPPSPLVVCASKVYSADGSRHCYGIITPHMGFFWMAESSPRSTFPERRAPLSTTLTMLGKLREVTTSITTITHSHGLQVRLPLSIALAHATREL